MALITGISQQGVGGVMNIDLFPGAHPADAFDKGVPVELANLAANHANKIVECAMTIYGQGNDVVDALNTAAETVNDTAKITALSHPCKMSAYFVGNYAALNAGAFYDKEFYNPFFKFVGGVLMYGLNSDKQRDGIGGIIGAIVSVRSTEKHWGKPTNLLHPAVHYVAERAWDRTTHSHTQTDMTNEFHKHGKEKLV